MFLQVILPSLPLHLPEQHLLLAVQYAPNGKHALLQSESFSSIQPSQSSSRPLAQSDSMDAGTPQSPLPNGSVRASD